MDDTYRAPRGQLKGWSRRNGEHVPSFEHEAEKSATKSESLIWYVDPDVAYPVWMQMAWLWIKVRIFRRDLCK